MSKIYDAVVVGSGFGGSVTACRLAQAGMRVCLLERGRRWTPRDFPLRGGDPGAWFWSRVTTGMYQFHTFKNMDVIVSAGLGGGSLVYANVLIEPPSGVFADGWPEALTKQALAPYYQRVREVLQPGPYPRASTLARTRAMLQAAEITGRRDQFLLPDLAVYWGRPGLAHPDPYGFGGEQIGCLDLAECVTGCPVSAKNTLDLNYIAMALQSGAECLTLCEVTAIARRGKHFTVYYKDRTGNLPAKGRIHSRRVILAAGALGSTSILLREAKKQSSLGPFSPALGRGFSANGNFLAALAGIGREVDYSVGPTITSAIRYPEDQFIIEDAALPPALVPGFDGRPPAKGVLPLLLVGRDAADGRLRLTDRLRKLVLDWSPVNSQPLFRAMERRLKELAAALGGKAIPSPAWMLARRLLTVHPLGGCRMADSPALGVVNDRGAVYGQPGLYVADGSIVPVSLGVNPALTIAALAERVAEHIVLEI